MIGTLRRDCLDHVLIFGELHLRRILTLYSLYYNETRTHLGLVQGRPAPTIRPTIWNHYGHTNLVRIASSLRADMIFGKDSPQKAHIRAKNKEALRRTAVEC